MNATQSPIESHENAAKYIGECYDMSHYRSGKIELHVEEVAQLMQEYAKRTCPFCGESDYDLEGLKYHLTRYCTKYHETPE